MCGIAGFIGRSKNCLQTYNILTELLSNSEIRGEDATGFWATENGKDGSIIHHKEPIKASEFVKLKAWTNLRNMDLNLMIAHARGASTGVGSPYDNKNNHPFVSSCQTLALVHNGRVAESDYRSLRKKYEVQTDCDSEILLRIFEGAEHLKDNIDELLPLPKISFPDELNEQTKKRLIGLKDIWSFSNHTQMAVAIGEKLENNHRRLWLFRNEHRSLWLFDMRKELGQVFFCSTPEIWQDAFTSSKMNKIFKKISINELPTEEIWSLEINDDNEVVDKKNLNKYIVSTSNSKEVEFSSEIVPIVNKPKYPKVITLPEEVKPEQPFTVPVHNSCSPDKTRMAMFGNMPHSCLRLEDKSWHQHTDDYDELDDNDAEILKIDNLCDDIIKSVESFNNNFNLVADKLLQYKLRSMCKQLEMINKDIQLMNNKM